MHVDYQPARSLPLVVSLGQVRWLTVARAACLSLIGSIVVLFAVALPLRFAQLVATLQNLTPAQELVLRDLGVSGGLSAGLVFGIEVSVAAAFISVGMLIFWRRSDDP